MYTSHQTYKRSLFSRKKPAEMSDEGGSPAEMLNKLQRELDFVHNNLDNVTDPTLIDSYIYEIKSIHMKYEYYLNLCKKKEAGHSFVS